jgi:hypothetical protein
VRNAVGLHVCGKSDADELIAQELHARFEGQSESRLHVAPSRSIGKRYGNETGDAYIEWLGAFGHLFKRMLTPTARCRVLVRHAWCLQERAQNLLMLNALR